MEETSLFGTNPEFTAKDVEADFDGDGTVEFGEALPDANVLLGSAQAFDVYAKELQTTAERLGAQRGRRLHGPRGDDPDDERVLRELEELALRVRRRRDGAGVRRDLAALGHHRHPVRASRSSTPASSRAWPAPTRRAPTRSAPGLGELTDSIGQLRDEEADGARLRAGGGRPARRRQPGARLRHRRPDLAGGGAAGSRDRRVRLRWAALALVLLLAPTSAGAAEPWQDADAVRGGLLDAQLALGGGDADAARTALEGLPEVDPELQAAGRGRDRGRTTRRAFAGLRGRIWTALLADCRAARDRRHGAGRPGDARAPGSTSASTARPRASRAPRPTPRSRSTPWPPGGSTPPPPRRRSATTCSTRTTRACARPSRTCSRRRSATSPTSAPRPRAAPPGYFAIIRDAYAAQRGSARRRRRDRGARPPGRRATTAALQEVRDAVAAFRAVALTPEELARRAGQSVRFIDLVRVEYGRGVHDGQVTKAFEINEATELRARDDRGLRRPAADARGAEPGGDEADRRRPRSRLGDPAQRRQRARGRRARRAGGAHGSHRDDLDALFPRGVDAIRLRLGLRRGRRPARPGRRPGQRGPVRAGRARPAGGVRPARHGHRAAPDGPRAAPRRPHRGAACGTATAATRASPR